MNDTRKPFNPEYSIRKETLPSEDDIVIKHPANGSNIRIKDNGVIQMFAGNNLGIKIDPNYNAITFYANKANFFTPNIHFITDDNGLKWNFTPFNRALADPTSEIVTSRLFGTETLINLLTTGGAFISAPPGAPVVPGTIAIIKALGFKGQKIYKGIEQVNMLSSVTNAMKEIAGQLDMSSLKGLI